MPIPPLSRFLVWNLHITWLLLPTTRLSKVTFPLRSSYYSRNCNNAFAGSLGMHIVRSLKFLVHFERSRFQCIIRYELSIRNYSERTLFHPKIDACPKLCTITICIITISTVYLFGTEDSLSGRLISGRPTSVVSGGMPQQYTWGKIKGLKFGLILSPRVQSPPILSEKTLHS